MKKKKQLLTYDFCEVKHFAALKEGDNAITVEGVPYLDEIRYYHFVENSIRAIVFFNGSGRIPIVLNENTSHLLLSVLSFNTVL